MGKLDEVLSGNVKRFCFENILSVEKEALTSDNICQTMSFLWS